MTSLADLFPDEDYRFHLTLKRGDPREFFCPRDPTGRVLLERRRWLTENPRRYVAALPESEEALAEFGQMASGWRLGPSAFDGRSPTAAKATGESQALQVAFELGVTLEPDVLLLTREREGDFRLTAGALCFPTGWALEEKLGHGMDFIHGVVPGLNQTLGSAIQQFFAKLKPGAAFLRDNWGIAANEELNLHPARELPAPSLPVALERLWLRVEHQALFALPNTGAIVFAIRIALHRLDQVATGPGGRGLRRALQTMASELAAYKRLDGIRAEVIRLLDHP